MLFQFRGIDPLDKVQNGCIYQVNYVPFSNFNGKMIIEVDYLDGSGKVATMGYCGFHGFFDDWKLVDELYI